MGASASIRAKAVCETSPENEAIVRNLFIGPAPQFCFVHIAGDSVDVLYVMEVVEHMDIPTAFLDTRLSNLYTSPTSGICIVPFRHIGYRRYPGFGTIDFPLFSQESELNLITCQRATKDLLIFLCRARV